MTQCCKFDLAMKAYAGIIYSYVEYITYSMAQKPLKNFDCPLMRVSLSNSILGTQFLLEAE